MPKAGMAMEEGQIIKWLKQEGDKVETGEAILEIETDKVAMEVEAERSGVLLKITRGEGETVPVTEPIGYIGDEGEKVPEEAAGGAGGEQAGAAAKGAAQDASEAPAESGSGDTGAGRKAAPAAAAGTSDASKAAGGKFAATPWARTLAERHGIDLSSVHATGAHGEIKGRDVETAAAAGGGAEAGAAVNVTPVARRVAEQQGVDLSAVTGSGPQGRITKEDVLAAAEAAAERGPEAATPAPSRRAPAQGPAGGPPAEGEAKRLSGMRRAIARNMQKSHETIPPVTLNSYADVRRLLEMRAEANEEDPDNKLSVNDFVLRATVEALRRHPEINATVDMEKEQIVEYGTVNLGVAVALPDGLIVPVVRQAETLSLRGLGARVRELASAARDRSIAAEQLEGGTFTVTNLGMYGITTFSAIINPPQVAILAVGSIEEQLVRNEDGSIGDRKTLGLSLTIDHRVIDGAQGAEFLATLRTLLEHPIRFLAA
jgi:pyruvate dehydrogenase E2 component (dihydrolipoamide acetyltransferase)